MMVPELTTQSYSEALPLKNVALDKKRLLLAKVCVASRQMGFGLQELRELEASGLHPPKQKASVPQKPNSLQHGKADGHGVVALQVVA